MHLVEGKNLNEITVSLLELIIKKGYNIDSRNGSALSIFDIDAILESPKSRHLHLNGRKNNIFGTIAETFWFLAGEENIHPYLTYFLPRAPEYSDNGTTWRGAYGERIYAHDQLETIIECFKEDGLESRRAVISLYFPNRDTKKSLQENYDLDSTKDIPCNNLLNFFITPNKRLNLKTTQRSGDIIYGVSNINIFQFTLLQEMILYILNQQLDNTIALGYYHHSVTNLHLYENLIPQGQDIVNTQQQLGYVNNDKVFFAKTIQDNKSFFKGIINCYNNHTKLNNIDSHNFTSTLKNIFHQFDIPIKNNILWAYSLSVAAYIYQKQTEQEITIDLSSFSKDFSLAISNNSFNKSIKVITND